MVSTLKAEKFKLHAHENVPDVDGNVMYNFLIYYNNDLDECFNPT